MSTNVGVGMIMGVNGNIFQLPQFYNTPDEKQFIEETKPTSCDREECTKNPTLPCHCTNQMTLPYDKTIQMVSNQSDDTSIRKNDTDGKK